MTGQEVVIVDGGGTEHVFPAGFDPKRAAAIVQQQAAPKTADVPRDARGMPAVSSNTSDAGSSPLMEMLGPLAHPQTFTDFARLLTLPVDSVKKAIAGALTMHAARNATAATGQVVKGAGDIALRGAAKVGDVVDPDVIGAISPRAGKVVELAQKVRDARAAAAAKVAQAAPPAVAPVAEAAPAAAPVAQTVTNSMPDQKLLNELAIQARRAGVKLTPEMEQTAIEAVGKGATPQQAVRGFAPLAPAEAAPAATAPPAPSAAVSAAAKARLSGAEVKEYLRLLKTKSHAEALDLIEQQRELAKRLNLPTAEDARRSVADRNASGRWESRD